ncbi:aminotransferase class I/II-fold pyridoxal phosphate-dependent enzyme [Ornithinimicrobium sp. INDO-MA30-4]|uniref:aminotransferase class I/II-fold pyridoxal phosphate-dependent enzyme n=1 Tax=Ornithinimicrobium sp. INDO-MA30-4 TaxID=2908651 RepID=UPI002882DE59|nr:aminotransferase class I/II-fold pyridoxal phosphate-dependent enzyme [Ornithinimicrobium sp. INDO-MA30-4]
MQSHLERYAVNREIVKAALTDMGLSSAPPDGAFYAWCDIGHLTDDSNAWCTEVLETTGVALTPGVDFDTAKGHRMMRFSFAGSTAEVTEALSRLAASPLLQS